MFDSPMPHNFCVLKMFNKSSGYPNFVAMHAQDSVSVAASALLNDCDLPMKYSSVWKVKHLEQKWKDMQSRQIIPLNVSTLNILQQILMIWKIKLEWVISSRKCYNFYIFQ